MLKRLPPSPRFWDPCDGINDSLPSVVLLALPKCRRAFQTLAFVTIITTKLPVRAPPPKWRVFSLTLLLLNESPGKPGDPHFHLSPRNERRLPLAAVYTVSPKTPGQHLNPGTCSWRSEPSLSRSPSANTGTGRQCAPGAS